MHPPPATLPISNWRCRYTLDELVLPRPLLKDTRGLDTARRLRGACRGGGLPEGLPGSIPKGRRRVGDSYYKFYWFGLRKGQLKGGALWEASREDAEGEEG